MQWEHCTFYSESKHELLLYKSEEKKSYITLFKKLAASAFFFTNSNIYFINWNLLEDFAFLWITELIFSCITTVSENCFTSVLLGVNQLLFSTMGLLADNLASHRRLLTVTVLTGNFRSLIALELITGWVFATLAILRSIRMVVFRFLPRLSGFDCQFKALEIILAEQPIIFCTSLYVFPSPINFLIKVCCSSEQRVERPILLRISERNALQPAGTCAAFVLK